MSAVVHRTLLILYCQPDPPAAPLFIWGQSILASSHIPTETLKYTLILYTSQEGCPKRTNSLTSTRRNKDLPPTDNTIKLRLLFSEMHWSVLQKATRSHSKKQPQLRHASPVRLPFWPPSSSQHLHYHLACSQTAQAAQEVVQQKITVHVSFFTLLWLESVPAANTLR